VSATVASAAGVNIRYNACFGDAGVANKNFACNSNTGTNLLVLGFNLSADQLGVTGIEIMVDGATAGTALPDWWKISGTGLCRNGALTVNNVISATAANCADWASGASLGALAAYQIGNYGPTSFRAKIGYAVGTPVDLPAGEYFGANMIFSNTKTVGTGSCAGCSTAACIMLSSVNVVSGTSIQNKQFGPSNGTDSNYVTWQGGAGVSSTIGSGCPAATPTKNTTWGSVKSLYR
jgi:hypothetical protein